MNERRSEDRRDDDVRLAEEVAELRTLLEEEREHNGDRFAASDHGHREIYRLIEVLEGKATMMPSGRTLYEGGLISEVHELTKAMRNGGFKIKIPVMGWVAIVAAIIAGAFQVWSALVAGGVGG